MASEPQYRNAFALSTVPVTGRYRFADVFQLLPAPPQAPRPPAILNDHPCIIEYRFTLTETEETLPDGKPLPGWVAHNNDAARALSELLLLLTSFSNEHFFIPRNHQAWFIGMGTSEGAPEPKTTQWGQEYYSGDGLQPQLEGFTASSISEVERRDPQAYFNRYGKGVGDTFSLPDNIDALFKAYYALDQDSQFAFLSAASLLSHSIRAWSVYPSLSFAAAISALETLIAFRHSGESVKQCKECGQPRHRTTAKFREFVEEFGGSSAGFKKYADVLYKRRSGILHRGHLFSGEVHPTRFGSFEMEDLAEMDLRRGVVSTCRICFVNWLLHCPVLERSPSGSDAIS